jgi:two-component system, cell cycle sensor histidine kinase and response regulator CckA
MTCIYLHLNRPESPEPWQEQPDPRARPNPPRLASILIAEDNESVLEVTARMLADAGFEVLGAPDGVAALDIIMNRESVDLLITDIRMPRMGGAELSRKALERHPDLPIIYVSGYPADWNAEAATLSRRQVFLRKPFTLDDLLRAIERLLAE